MGEQLALGFGDLLRQLRAEAGLTQEELAEAASLSPRSVSDLERGIHRTARQDTAMLLADALGLAEPARPLFVAAARGRAPAAEALAALRAAAAPEGPAPGPYLGLVPFEERDARLFYGRDELADQLVRRLAERLHGSGILLVTGESGSGKSSLLRAGLLPRLAAGALGSQRWPRRVIRPTASPLRELAMVLAEVAGADPVSVYRSLQAAPGEAPMLAGQAARTAAGRDVDPGPGGPAGAASGAPPRLVLVVDQFEEVFTAAGDGDAGRAEREAFITALHAAATIPAGPAGLPPALVAVVVRADYLGRLIADPSLKAALDAGPFTVGPMSEAELRLAVTGPAAEAGLAVQPALVEAVVAELRDQAGGGLGSGVLPLMSQAMAATWQYREGNELTLRGYRRAGGVADAVNRGAEAAYDALTRSQQDAARLVFTQLTVITPDGRLARRRCRRTDLSARGPQMAADIDAVIDVFSARRLLILGADSIEIAHDALLSAWKQLRDWLGDDQLDRALYGQVVTDAAAWDSHGRDSAYLYRPGRLATIDAAAARWQGAPARYPPLPATSEAFLGAAHHAARRGTRRRRGVIAGLLALTVIAISAAGLAARDAATAARQHAIALSRQLATESLAADSANPLTARRLALAAWHVFPTDQAGSVLASLLLEQQQRGILPGGPAHYSAIGLAFSPDGRLLAGTYGDGYVRLWDPVTGQLVGSPLPADTRPDANGGVFGVAFSPDGRLLAAAGGDGYVRLWNSVTRRPIGAPLPADTGPNGGLGGLAFSPDGKLLAAVGADSTVQVLDPGTHRAVGAAFLASTSPEGPAHTLAFSPDGTLLATADMAGYVRLWDPVTRRPIGAPFLAATSGGVIAVAFSPDGRLLVTADGDGTVRLWDPVTRRPIGVPLQASTGPGDSVFGVAFSPDGTLLATSDTAGYVRLWDPVTRRPIGAPFLAATSGGVIAVAFSPDGRLLATAGDDGTVRLWNPVTRQPPRAPLPAVTGGVKGMAFSPDGRLLASADGDGTVRTWDPATRQLAGVLAAETGPGSYVNAVAFSPHGTLLASADGDGTVKLWNPSTGQASGAFPGVNGVAFSPDGKLLAAGEAGGTVKLWDLATRQFSGASLPDITNGSVSGVAFSPDGKLLASANTDGYVRLWDLATRQAVGAPLPADPAGGVLGVAFSPDGTLLASADGDGTVRLWDPATGKASGAPVLASTSPGTSVLGVAFSPDGKLLAATYSDGHVRLWDPATGKAVGVPLPADAGTGGTVSGVTFSPDGKLLATADTDGTVRLWQMPLLTDPYAALCADVGPPTKAEWTQYAPGEPQPSVCR
jgi:WD40 repeat protein/transcriptional regulator with XRE-family HTH domain